MKKLIVGTLLVGLSACGNLADFVEDLDQKGAPLNVGEVTATGHALSESLIGIQGLSGGIAGLAPNLGGKGGIGFAPALRAAPGLAPSDNNCTGIGSFVIEEPKTDYTAEQEEQSATIKITGRCEVIGEPGIPSSVEAAVVYKDGSTGTTLAYELDDAPSPTTDGNLFTGYIALDVSRYFAAGDERKSAHFIIEVDLGGAFENPPRTRYYRKANFEVVMSNGAQVNAEIVADEPIVDGEELTKGTATRTTIHAEGGAIVKTTEEATLTGKDTGSYHLVNEFEDGTKDDIKVTSDGTTVTVDAKGHNGFIRQGSLTLATGAFKLTTTFPAGSVIKTVVEEGTWLKDATSGSYERTVTMADDTIDHTKFDIQITGNTINATFTHNDLSGDIEIVKSDSETSLKLNITNKTGDKASLVGTRYADGSAKLHYTKDLKSTTVNPDEEGDFTFQADGSGTGTVVAKNDAGATVTLTVVIKADGTTEGDGSVKLE